MNGLGLSAISRYDVSYEVPYPLIVVQALHRPDRKHFMAEPGKLPEDQVTQQFTAPAKGISSSAATPRVFDEPTLAAQKSMLQQRSSSNDTRSNEPLSGGSGKIFGDYKIEAEIARGGMGVVYRARQISLNRPVAIKMILSGNLAGEEDVKRFYVEAEAAAGLEHPNIVPIYEIGQVDGQHFFSMGYVDGGSLDRLISENTLPVRTAVQLMIHVSEAIQFAHDHGIIHRDLKPANILLARASAARQGSSTTLDAKNSAKGGRASHSGSNYSTDLDWIPKVSDFGLAKQLNAASELTGTGQILGTPSYMPPEQAEGDNAAVGALSDVYSLGAILYRTLTGRPPFQSSSPMETILQLLHQDPVSPRQLNSSIPIELETICLKCLQKVPAKRYSSARELAEDLQRWMQGDPILARPISAFSKAVRWTRKHPAICGSVLVVIASIAAIVGVLAKSNQSLAFERDIAIKAQKEADSQRATAESRLKRAIESIDGTLARVGTKRWAMDPTLQDERRAILENSIQFYSGLIADSSDTEEVRYQAVRGYEQVAGAKFLLNDTQGSEEACARGLALCEKLCQDHPENESYAAKLASLLSLSGTVVALGGKTKEGFDQMLRAVNASRTLSDKFPNVKSYQIQAVEAMSNYAYFVLSSQGEARESGRALLPEILNRANALDSSPDASPLQRVVASFALSVGGAYALSNSSIDGAKNYFERARQIVNTIEDVSQLDARHADSYFHVRAIASLNLGVCYMNEGPKSMEKAVSIISDGLEPMESLVRIHPDTFVYKMQLMQGLRAKSTGLKSLGRVDEAKELDIQIAKLTEELVRENPEQPWVQAIRSVEQSVVLVERCRKGEVPKEELDAEVASLMQKVAPNNRNAVLYNLVCAYAQASKSASDTDKDDYIEKVRKLLEDLKKMGAFKDARQRDHIQVDEDLTPIRDQIDWEKLLSL